MLTVRDIYNILDDIIDPVKIYFVDLHTHSVRLPKKDPTSDKLAPEVLHNNKPVLYTVPEVAYMYLTDYHQLKNRVEGIRPLDGKLPATSTSFIDYGSRNPDKLFKTYEEAEATITPELVHRFISQKFVDRHPQILDANPELAEFFEDPRCSEERSSNDD